MKSLLQFIKPEGRLVFLRYFAIIAASALLTGVTIWIVKAAPANLEAESGTISANATNVLDTTASGNSAVLFDEGGVSGGLCPVGKRVITAQDVSQLKNSGYPAGTEVFVPDGPDPWGGCFPGPETTGIPDGTTLTNYTGSCTISTNGTVIDSKTISNCDTLNLNGQNITISKSRFIGTNININGSATISDFESDFGDITDGEGLRGYNFTLLRANMQGGKRQVWCLSTCTIQDSYLHDQLADPAGETHESAIRVEQYTTLTHNTLLCNAPNYPPDAGCSANQTGYPDFAPIHHNTMQRNFYMATTGGYCSYGGASNSNYTSDPTNATYVQLIDNVFQRGTAPNDRTYALTDKRRYTCGQYGATSSYNSSKTGFSFTGNMWDDGLLFTSDTSYPYSFY